MRLINQIINSKSHTLYSVLFGFLAFSTHTSQIFGQVNSRYLESWETMEDYVYWFPSDTIQAITIPEPDINDILLKDSLEGRTRERYSFDVVLDYTIGTMLNYGNYKVWKYKIVATNAQFVGITFANSTLAKGSEMYVYSEDSSYLYGPIKASNFNNGKYKSDVFPGDQLTVEVLIPNSNEDTTIIIPDKLTYGISLFMFDDDFGLAPLCNPNVKCPEGNGWETEISSVCKIICDGHLCTGSLLNTECQSFESFVLTANHCIDDILNHLDELLFRFHYESPVCTTSTGSPQGNELHPRFWVTFSGSELISRFDQTDFALLKMNGEVSEKSKIGFAGWDRRENIPTSTRIINHLGGDVKKMVHDSDPATITDFPQASIPDGNAFRISLDIGTVGGQNDDFGVIGGGASGSPQMDQNQRVVGQLAGGDTGSCESSSQTVSFGRLSQSWIGNGNNDGQLRHWLGPNVEPNTTSSTFMPEIIGADVICTSATTFQLENEQSGSTVSWSALPASLFSSIASGSGNTAHLTAAIGSQGLATIEFTTLHPDCGEKKISKEVWVGLPDIKFINHVACFTSGKNFIIEAVVLGAKGKDISWQFPSCPNGPPVGDPDEDCWFNYTGNGRFIKVYAGLQLGQISVTATNDCGTKSRNFEIPKFCEGGHGGGPATIRSSEPLIEEKIVVEPNPSKGVFRIYNTDDRNQKGLTTTKILSANGMVVEPFESIDIPLNITVNLSKLPKGLYFVHIERSGNRTVKKIMIN